MQWYFIILLIAIAFGVVYFMNTQTTQSSYRMDIERKMINEHGTQHTQFIFNYYDILLKRDNGFSIKAEDRATLTTVLRNSLTSKLNSDRINNYQYQKAKSRLATYSYII